MFPTQFHSLTTKAEDAESPVVANKYFIVLRISGDRINNDEIKEVKSITRTPPRALTPIENATKLQENRF